LVPDGDLLLVHDSGGRLTSGDRSAIRSRKAELLAALRRSDGRPSVLDRIDVLIRGKRDIAADTENEFNWSQIENWDRVYLLGPRDWPDRCFICSGILNHSPACIAQQREWSLAVPLTWGKYRGKTIGEIKDLDYLRWLQTEGGLPPEIREAIRLRFQREGKCTP
jgi:hypothetical protein